MSHLKHVLIVFTMVLISSASIAQIPANAHQYRQDIEAAAVEYYGIDAPVARLAAQVHAESSWRPEAQSPYAQGLMQITPATAAWLAEINPQQLKPHDPWNPQWSIRAGVYYTHWLHQRYGDRWATACDAWAGGVLSPYNGGWRHVITERAMAVAADLDRARWFSHVEMMVGRSESAWRENRRYVQKILMQLEPMYLAAGWHGKAVC
jgi:soluble lytic murein transglycosylase-like protein